MYYLFDKDTKIVKAVSDQKIYMENCILREINMSNEQALNIINTKIDINKDFSNLKVAVVSNWNDKCGISTYSEKISKEIFKKVKEFKVFAELNNEKTNMDEEYVERCWRRGESLIELGKKIKEYNPDILYIQHEFGLFPNAFYFMQLMERIKDIKYAVVLHSIYKHEDKAVYMEPIKNIIIHTERQKNELFSMGNFANKFLIPHGCDQFENTEEIWNIMRNPYVVMQFGFGFEYKGVENAIKAIAHLKETDSKFKNIFYFYLCSTNNYSKAAHNSYYEKLFKLREELNVEKNIAIVQKFHTNEMINKYLRLAKIAIFPYILRNDGNDVFGASGSIRVAMSNKRPVIASNNHLFDDFDGIIPRPSNHLELAKEIDEIFSNEKYKNSIVEKSYNYVINNTWEKCAEKYLEIYNFI